MAPRGGVGGERAGVGILVTKEIGELRCTQRIVCF